MSSSFKESWYCRNLANILTVSRATISVILLIIGISGIKLVFQVFWLGIVGGLTDLFDGIVARGLKIISTFGTMLDPITDKFYIFALTLICWRWLPPEINFWLWLLTTVLAFGLSSQDGFLLTISYYTYKQGIRPRSNRWGQRKMAAECTTIGAWFIFGYRYPIVEINQLLLIVNIMLLIANFFASLSIRGHWREYYHKLQVPNLRTLVRSAISKLFRKLDFYF